MAFGSPERTLTDEDAAVLRGRIVDALAKRFGASSARVAIRPAVERRRRGVRALPLVLLLLSALGSAGGARADNPVLTGVVGTNDAYTNRALTGPTGSPVRNLDPGTYTLLVHDNSQIHDFHLEGPGVDVSTADRARPATSRSP